MRICADFMWDTTSFGTGSNSTAEAVSLTTHAEKVGADAALIVTPYYNKPSQEGIYAHFSTIAQLIEDKPIMFDYWTSSCDKEVLIGVRDSGEKLLVKSADEYTSPISKIYKVETEYIIITENSIYVVSSDIETKRVS